MPLNSARLLRKACASGRIAETLQAGFVQMRGLFQAQPLRHRDQAIHAEVGEGFVRVLHGAGVQFQPAGVGQFDEPAGGGLQPLQIRRRQFDAFRLPLGGNGKPIDAAALDDQTRAASGLEARNSR